MRFRLRTLLIVLALGPMVLAGAWFAVQLIVPDAPAPTDWPYKDMSPRPPPGVEPL